MTALRHDHDHPHLGHAQDLEEAELSHHMALTEAVAGLLITRGLFTADELRRTLEDIDARTPAAGARMVARA